jgi:hypothetical protein
MTIKSATFARWPLYIEEHLVNRATDIYIQTFPSKPPSRSTGSDYTTTRQRTKGDHLWAPTFPLSSSKPEAHASIQFNPLQISLGQRIPFTTILFNITKPLPPPTRGTLPVGRRKHCSSYGPDLAPVSRTSKLSTTETKHGPRRSWLCRPASNGTRTANSVCAHVIPRLGIGRLRLLR